MLQENDYCTVVIKVITNIKEINLKKQQIEILSHRKGEVTL